MNMYYLCLVIDICLEECPKWSALSEVLAEIEKLNSKTDKPGRVVIAAADDRTCSQLKQVCVRYIFLQHGLKSELFHSV